VGVTAETVSARRAVTDVASGRLDVAIVGLPILAPGLRTTVLSGERTVAAVPDRHRLSGQSALQLDRLGETPLILPSRCDNPAFHDGVLAACRSVGTAPTLIETNESSVDHTLLLVAAGMGIAVLPESATRYTAPAVRFLPVTEPDVTTEIALLTRGDEMDVVVEGLLSLARDRSSRLRVVEPVRARRADAA
jgi:DNA-binding transcriptional LysR family regulator